MAESITCPKCGFTSFNPNDVRERYCGNCHDWISDNPTTVRLGIRLDELLAANEVRAGDVHVIISPDSILDAMGAPASERARLRSDAEKLAKGLSIKASRALPQVTDSVAEVSIAEEEPTRNEDQ